MSLIIIPGRERPDCDARGCRERAKFKVWLLNKDGETYEKHALYACGSDTDRLKDELLSLARMLFKDAARVRVQDLDKKDAIDHG